MKKRVLSLLLTLALCAGLAVPALADTVDSVWNGDFSVLFTVTTNFYSEWGLYDDQYYIMTITGYSGSDTDIVLPTVDQDGDAIVAVNDSAFQGKTNLTSVVIPDGFSSLGRMVFSGCTSLKSVTMSDSVLKMASGVFNDCPNLTSVTLSNSLTEIPQGTFSACDRLPSVVIPEGVTSIGNSAFWGCSSLTSINIPASVTSIDYGAFMDCEKLTDVYYGGTAAQWTAISINNNQNYNDALLNATIHYSSAPSTQPEPVEPETPAGFTDVPAGMYYAEPVAWAVEQNITTGTTATTFSPEESCTRGQIITFLWRAAGSPQPTGENPFEDVAEGAYYAAATAWAAEQGMAEGTAFDPEAPCTREMAVEFMWKYAGSPDAAEAGFEDVTSDAVNWALEAGVTTGTSDTAFSPDTTCTRGQIVTFLWRAAGSPQPTGENPFEDVAEGAYYAAATAWAAEQGMAEGTAFDPEAPCTREMAVEFMWKYAGSPDAAEAGFEDVTSDAVNWALEAGVTTGTSDTAFSPDTTCTRGQIVTFLWRAFA